MMVNQTTSTTDTDAPEKSARIPTPGAQAPLTHVRSDLYDEQ